MEYNALRLGHEVSVIDCHLGGGLGLLLEESYKDWDIIGLSAQFSIQHDVYLEAVNLCRKNSAAEIIAGGFHAYAVERPDGVSRIIAGDGESSLVPWMDFEDVEYAYPSDSRMRAYWAKGSPHDLQSKTDRWMPVEFSRGCNRTCGYCGVKRFWAGTRYYSQKKIEGYLDALVTEGIEEVFIEDDNCASDPAMFRWIIRELRKRRLWWSTPNGVYAKGLADNIGNLADSGCWRVSLPFETGTASTAKLMRLGDKWMPQPEALELVLALKAESIKTCGFFIIGYPGETLDDMKRTLDYANSLPLDQRNISIATPYPGTPLYDTCKANGYLDKDGPELYRELLYTHAMIRTPEFSPEQVEALKWADREAAIARLAK
jgi:radical SAM superfamily enzyme YgiQ (UPF0313 family)